MRTRSFLPLSPHACACLLLGLGFLWFSAPEVWRAIRATSFGPVLPYHTTNSYMVSLLGVEDGSERLLRAAAMLPPGRPVVILRPDGAGQDVAVFSSFLVSYFNWPHEVRLIPVKRENAALQLDSIDRASVAAIFFCGIDPPPGMQPLVRIGKGLVMVPITAVPEASSP